MSKYGEPWEFESAVYSCIDEATIVDTHGQICADVGFDDAAAADTIARRICLCVNALAGIPDEALERGVVDVVRNAMHIIWRSSFADRMSADEMRVALDGINEQAAAALALLTDKEPQP